MVEVEEGERSIEGFEKFGGAVFDDDFGLDDEAIAGQEGEDFSELNFGGAVGTGGFDVVDPEIHGAADGGFEVLLVGFGDLVCGEIVPFVLIPHSATGEDGHLQVGASEAAVLHGSKVRGEGSIGLKNRDTAQSRSP